ncbi:hypothetical protein [Acidithiobacillus ferrianus]|uniref:hypothetical protein n=1 Tax=Acidithiobacillus ferrianus TaxID=2678518 RepID=UPI0034E5D38B
MTLPKNSQALKCYRLGLGCREHPAVVISDIVRAAGVSTEEAERRYAKAKEQHSKRAAAQFTRGLRQRGALESMQWAILCLCDAAHAQMPNGTDIVPITDALLDDLAFAYKDAAHVRRVPARGWVTRQIETLYHAGLIVRGMAGMRITDAGLAYIVEKTR